MSTAIAALIVTMARLRPITSGEFTRSTGRNATSWLSWSQSYSSRLPAAKVATDTPSYCGLRFTTLPAWWSRMRPFVNISEWMP